MNFKFDDPSTWPVFRPLIIAHDVGRRYDGSTAVVGGLGPFELSLIGLNEINELRDEALPTARSHVSVRLHAASLMSSFQPA